jgi:hypothetical protein
LEVWFAMARRSAVREMLVTAILVDGRESEKCQSPKEEVTPADALTRRVWYGIARMYRECCKKAELLSPESDLLASVHVTPAIFIFHLLGSIESEGLGYEYV